MTRLDAMDMMVNYLGDDPEDSLNKLEDTRGCHARYGFLENLYVHYLAATMEVDGDDAQVINHISCALRSYLMYLVCKSTFMDKSAYYVDVVYFRYFIDFKWINEYN